MKNRFILLMEFAIYQLLLLNLLTMSKCFNIDEQNPILITDKYDHPKSRFGASVVLLEMISNLTNSDSTGWILIGAPLANSSHPNHTNFIEPGVIWRCSLGRNKTENECQIVIMDPTGEYDPKNKANAHTDWKSDSRLGEVMSIGKSDRFVACASRWINQKYKADINAKFKEHYVNGICYWLPKTHLQMEANETWPWLSGKHSYRLLPLIAIAKQMRTTTDQNNKTTSTRYWASGQAGFSLQLTEKNELLLGAPGVNHWTGSIVEYLDGSTAKTRHTRYNSNGQKEFSEWYVSQPININASIGNFGVDGSRNSQCSRKIKPLKTRQPIGTSLAYFGYAVTSGRYFNPECINSNQTQYAAGAPRANDLTGKVYIFTAEKESNKLESEIYVLREVTSDEPGSDYASYFGSVLCSTDLNNDGFDELIVGAPMYSISDSNADTSGDEGCVFVYFSNGSQLLPPLKICGNYSESRFGSAISSLGDINGDNFNDIAVGAPYENGRRGAVYIYSGAQTTDFLKLTQKLTPQKIHQSIRGFGYSLSLGVDIDNNSYPDLAVGCYESNQVVVYRTIPLIKVTGEIRAEIPELWVDVKDFGIKSCVSFYGISIAPTLIINFIVTLVLDAPATLLEWSKNQTVSQAVKVIRSEKHILKYEAPFQTSNTCYSFIATKVRNADKKFSPQGLTQHFELVNRNTSDIPQVIHYEISRNENNTPSVQFNRSSKADFRLFSERQPFSMETNYSIFKFLPTSHMCINGQPDQTQARPCRANLLFTAIFQNASGFTFGTNPYIVGTSSKLTLNITIKNDGDVADLLLEIKIGWNSEYITSQPVNHCKQMTSPQNSKKTLTCILQKSLVKHAKHDLLIDFDTTNMYAGQGENEVHFTFTSGSSSDLVVGEANFNFTLPLSYKSEIILYDSPKPTDGAYFMNWTSKMITFGHEYGVSLSGPSPVHNLQTEFRVPVVLTLNKRNKTIIHLDKVEGQFGRTPLECKRVEAQTLAMDRFETFSNSQRYRNYLNDGGSGGQVANDTAVHNKNRRTSRSKSRGYLHVSISCASSFAYCVTIRCSPIKRFRENDYAIFRLHMRIDARDLVERLSLSIQTDVSGSILDTNNKQIGNSRYGRVIKVLKIDSMREIPAWVIIVALSTGLSILTILIFCLTKCGFFQRERRQHIKRHKKESESLEMDSRLRNKRK